MIGIHLQLKAVTGVHAADITNRLRDYYRIHFHPFDGDAFEVCAQPFTADFVTPRGSFQIRGLTCDTTADRTLSARSACCLADVAVRTRAFHNVGPRDLVEQVLQPYQPQFPYTTDLLRTEKAIYVPQFQETDYDFLARELADALVIGTADGVHFGQEPLRDRTLLPNDFPFGTGGWEVNVTSLAVQAISQILDPHRRLEANVDAIEIPTQHADVQRLLNAVRRFQQRDVPAAQFLTNSPSNEALRRKVRRLALRALANAAGYHFRTDRIDIAVGDRLLFPSHLDVHGPLTVVATEAPFDRGDYVCAVHAVPEPLAPYWGLPLGARCEALTLGTVLEGDDPGKLGRVPVALLHDPISRVWARTVTAFAAQERMLCSRHQPGEEVLIGFMHGDPAYPIVLGTLFHSRTKPVEVGPNETVLACGRITLRLTATGLEALAGDSRFRFTPEGMEWHAGNGQRLLLRPEGLAIETTQPLTLKGKSVSLEIPGGIWKLERS
jgi:hypothetical protein